MQCARVDKIVSDGFLGNELLLLLCSRREGLRAPLELLGRLQMLHFKRKWLMIALSMQAGKRFAGRGEGSFAPDWHQKQEVLQRLRGDPPAKPGFALIQRNFLYLLVPSSLRLRRPPMVGAISKPGFPVCASELSEREQAAWHYFGIKDGNIESMFPSLLPFLGIILSGQGERKPLGQG